MLKLPALMDGDEASYTLLGTLCPIQDEAAKPVTIKKKIQVYNLGSYVKTLTTPMYNKQSMSNYAVSSPGFSFDPVSCLGVLCGSMSASPKGYVLRLSGGHSFAIPVFEPQTVSPVFYRVAGYMATENGYLAVVKRRFLQWLILGLLAGATFVLSYLVLRYGTDGAWTELVRFLVSAGQLW